MLAEEKTGKFSHEDKEKLDDLNVEFASIKYGFTIRALMLLVEILITFLMQGVLIFKVWYETKSPREEEDNGFCQTHVSLQVAAITTLCLWTIGSFGDLWSEVRCYISKVCKSFIFYILMSNNAKCLS